MGLSAEIAALNSGLVAVVCGAVAVAAWRAMVRTGNRSIGYVVGAFALFTAKNLLKAVVLASQGDEGTALELAFSLVDLVAVGLIATPLVFHRGPR